MKFMAVFLASLVAGSLLANNITVTNVTVLNAANGLADISFDLNWDNSWHNTWPEAGGAINMTNWDAAWVFVKFRAAGGHWQHAILNASGHVATGGTQIETGANPAGQPVGAFVHRAADGNGTLNCPQMSLKWNYAATGLGGTNAVDVSVHAIEMVYIPQGAFYVGSGGSEVGAFYAGTNPVQPYQITSEAAITVGTNGLNHANASSGYYGYFVGDWLGPIPAAFPKGYNAFYVMKYEISQGQYTDFLNFLDPGLATTRFMNAYGSYRNTISQTGMVYACDAPDRACNNLIGSDLPVYLKWAALRPMDELEYEKACRGPVYPVPNEYPWGDTLMTPMTGFSGMDGSGTETATPANANANVGIGGPVRVGIFATATSGRHDAGASYYGVMNLGDNLTEIAVSVGNPNGRAFTNEPGDGNEWTPASTWPMNIGNVGFGIRGGCFQGSFAFTTSSRNWADNVYSQPNYNQISISSIGGRGVRSAP
jgi:formylglycine-generating enzyme required for sulfatase activity